MAGKLDGRKNYGIGENVPVENIEVHGPGRYYPDDYSAQINMFQRQNQYKASIPESFAKIVTDIDDYAITAHSLENETARLKQEELNKADLAIQKLNMQTDVGNQAYDQYKRVLSDLDEARNRALAENESVEAAYKEVLETNRNIETLNSPYASTLWSHMHNSLATSILPKAREIDTSTIQYQMAANLSDAASSIRSQIMRGQIGIEEGMNQLAVAMYPYLKELPSQQKDKIFREMYDSFVLGRADYLEVMLADKPEELILGLASLRDNYSKKDFKFYNDKNEVLLGDDGSELTYTVGLGYQTQSALTRALLSARNRKATGDTSKTESATGLRKDFDDSIGMKEISEKLWSDKARKKSDAQIDQSYNSFITGIRALGDAKLLKEGIQDGATLNTYKTLRALSQACPAAVPNIIDAAVTKLEHDLASKDTDFTTYELVIPVPGTKEGKRFDSFKDICNSNALMLGADAYNHGQAYYERMLESLKKYQEMARKSPANLLDAMDYNYHEAGQNLAKVTTVENLVNFQGGEYSYNEDGQKIIAEALAGVLTEGESKVGAALSDDCMQQVFNTIKNTNATTQAKNLAYVFLGASLGGAKKGGAALTGYFLKGNKDAHTQMAMSGLLLAGQTDKLNDIAKIYALKEESPDEYSAKLTSLSIDKLGFEKEMREWRERQHIPGMYGGMLDDTVKHLMLAGYSMRDAQNALNKNFVSINLPLGEQSVHTAHLMANDGKVFIHAPAYQNWGANARLIAQTMGKVKDQIQDDFFRFDKQHVLRFAVSENGETFEIYTDNKRVSAQILGQDAGSGVYLYNPVELGCERNINLASFLSANAAATQLKGFIAASFEGSMKDHMSIDSNYKWYENRYKKYNPLPPQVTQFKTQEEYKEAITKYNVELEENKYKDMTSERARLLANAVTARDINILREMVKGSKVFNKPNITVQDLYNLGIKSGTFQCAAPFLNTTQNENKKITADSIFNAEIEARSSYVNKINQYDVLVPLSYAAKGIFEYSDVYNASQKNGYDISGAYLPNVTQEEMPTGFGAGIFTVSKNALPEGLGSDYDYGREEINAIVDATASAFGVDAKLIHAVIKHESGYQQRVRGGSGEYGYMQLMPETARSLGVKDPLDGQQNIWGGTKLLAQNIRTYGDIDAALAAYNGGGKAGDAWKAGHPWKESVAYVKAVHENLGDKNYKYEYTVAHSGAKNYNKFFDADTGKLSAKKMNDFKYNLLNDPAYASGIKAIETSYSEIWTRPDLAFLRDMKNKDGKTLFKKSDYDGFKIVMERSPKWSKSDSVRIAAEGLAADMAKTQSPWLPAVTQEQTEALANIFADRANNTMDLKELFGLADLSVKEYNDYGVPLNMLENPVLQARVLTQEFQRAIDLLGNERKAVYALAGGNMVDTAGEIKSWAQIKQDKDAFTKSWFISPNTDKQEREQANALLAQYQNELHKIRGY